MKYKNWGRDNGKHRIELETGEMLEVTDAELNKFNEAEDGEVELVELPPSGTSIRNIDGSLTSNNSQASHVLKFKDPEVEQPAEGESESSTDSEAVKPAEPDMRSPQEQIQS